MYVGSCVVYIVGATAGYWWLCNITVHIYTMLYFGWGVPRGALGGHQIKMAYTMRTTGR